MEESSTSGDEGAVVKIVPGYNPRVESNMTTGIPQRTNSDPIVKPLVDESEIDSGGIIGARSSAKRETTSGYFDSEEVEEEDLGSDDYEDEREWDMETFDTRMLVQGAEDERYLDSLPELERENILAERFEKLKCEADMKKAIRENR